MRHVADRRFTIVAAASVVLGCGLAACSRPTVPAGNTPAVRYDATGRLRELAFDTTHNGRNNATGFMDGAQVQKIEVDEDEDGTIDRWEFYGARGRLERVGLSQQHNGVIDTMAFYEEGGEIERIEVSTRGDQVRNRIEFYQSNSLARVEEDINGDGRMDKWETYAADHSAASDSSPPIVSAAFDDSFRGTPNRRFIYRPDGTVLRAEVDPDGDGRFVEATGAPGQ